MSSKSSKLTRRDFLKLSGMGVAGVLLGGTANAYMNRYKQKIADVTIIRETSYHNNLADTLRRGIGNYPNVLRKIKGGRVVLKPNLVDYYPNVPVNTDPAMIAAAITAFRQLGASEVIVGEGPGHNRDMEMILEQSGFDGVLKDEKIRFVDLNLDSISPVNLVSNYTGLSQLFFPNTILGADLVVSMPKMKAHHWAGATLSLKNLFGTIPGIKYGWPKNFLHWHGIAESITDISTTINPGFAIVDGIVGMEGDGPLSGTAINAGAIVMGDNLTAVDSTAVRLMGYYPEQMQYLMFMVRHGGTANETRIRQLGESITALKQGFATPPRSEFLKEKANIWRTSLYSGW